MGYVEETAFCKQCDKQVLTRRRTANHILHLLLTLVSGFMWLIIWAICAAKQKGMARCTQCGRLINPNKLKPVTVSNKIVYGFIILIVIMILYVFIVTF